MPRSHHVGSVFRSDDVDWRAQTYKSAQRVDEGAGGHGFQYLDVQVSPRFSVPGTVLRVSDRKQALITRPTASRPLITQ